MVFVQDQVALTLAYTPPQYSENFSWAMEEGTQYRPYRNLHCVVLAGVEDAQYLAADPIKGFTQVDKETFWNSFSATGSRAVIVE